MPSAAELLASEHRLMVLLACTKGIVFELDRDARYLAAWTHDEALLARPPGELIGRTIDEVLGDEGRPFTAAVQRVHASGEQETLEYELVVQGGRRCFLADVMVSPEVAGRERSVVCLIRDITDRKRLEERLHQAEKLDAIGKLAAGIAHDFNNILTTIIGYSSLLLESLDTGTIDHKHADRIRHAATRASALTGQLLAYGRQRSLAPETVDISTVIAGLGDTLRQLVGPAVELRLELHALSGGAHMDRTVLDQILTNFALNARDALPKGGLLILRTDVVELDAAACAEITGAMPGRYVLLTAEDNGVGMDALTMARAFEPFFTTKEHGKGTGLGLSTVYDIVKQSGGFLAAASEPGRGARFRVYLPYVAFPDA